MSLPSSLYTYVQAQSAITTLIGTRFHPQIAPSTEDRPYSIYSRVSRRRAPATGGSTGWVSTTVRIIHFADDYEDVETLADKFRLALDGKTGTVGDQFFQQCFLESEADSLEALEFAQNTAPHFISQEYQIVHKETPTGL